MRSSPAVAFEGDRSSNFGHQFKVDVPDAISRLVTNEISSSGRRKAADQEVAGKDSHLSKMVAKLKKVYLAPALAHQKTPSIAKLSRPILQPCGTNEVQRADARNSNQL